MDGGVTVAQEPKISRETLDQVIQTTTVQQVLARRAALVLPRAQREAAKAGRTQLAKALRVETGVRPGSKAGGFKRPYARVIADYPEEARKADAGAKLTPRVILRRASRG